MKSISRRWIFKFNELNEILKNFDNNKSEIQIEMLLGNIIEQYCFFDFPKEINKLQEEIIQKHFLANKSLINLCMKKLEEKSEIVIRELINERENSKEKEWKKREMVKIFGTTKASHLLHFFIGVKKKENKIL
jgi:hypothetical protein